MRSMTFVWAIALIAAPCVPIPGAAQPGAQAAATLPAAVPLFPLPDVALLPSSTQPFHIFEPRYRAMVADALQGDSIIGMVMLQPGFEAEYEGRPPVYAIGCAGVIVASEELPDGRYNIVLRGLVKFRILSEDQSQPYRLADVEELPEAVVESGLLAQRRRQLEEAIQAVQPRAPLPPPELPDEEVIDGLSLVIPMEPTERQGLLEADGPAERAAGLVRILRGAIQAGL